MSVKYIQLAIIAFTTCLQGAHAFAQNVNTESNSVTNADAADRSRPDGPMSFMLGTEMPIEAAVFAVPPNEPADEPTRPDATNPVVVEPVATLPDATNPVVVEPVATLPDATNPVIVEPVATLPDATNPVVVEPVATLPDATNPVIVEPVATLPDATNPVIVEPVATLPDTSNSSDIIAVRPVATSDTTMIGILAPAAPAVIAAPTHTTNTSDTASGSVAVPDGILVQPPTDEAVSDDTTRTAIDPEADGV
ncbi:MAG: hypothetical protein AB7F82_07485 [Alphaproteobacteria bacterium]